MSAPLNVVQLSTDTPQVKAGEDGLVDVRAVVAWALTFRPDFVVRAREDLKCPGGTSTQKCEACGGYGIMCKTITVETFAGEKT